MQWNSFKRLFMPCHGKPYDFMKGLALYMDLLFLIRSAFYVNSLGFWNHLKNACIGMDSMILFSIDCRQPETAFLYQRLCVKPGDYSMKATYMSFSFPIIFIISMPTFILEDIMASESLLALWITRQRGTCAKYTRKPVISRHVPNMELHEKHLI